MTFLAIDTRPSTTITREQPMTQPTPPILNTFGQRPPPSVLGDLTNSTPIAPPITQTSTSMQPRHVPIRKDSHSANGVGFNFRTIEHDPPSGTPFSHIVTSVDSSNSIGSQGLRVNDYILSINDENVEYLDHQQLEDKLRRINNSETIRLLVTDGNVYRAYKESAKNTRTKPDFVEQTKLPSTSTSSPQKPRQCYLQRDPGFEGYGFRVRSNQQGDTTPHQIVAVEQYSPADAQGLRVGDYILRVNNQNVEHMNPPEFNQLMQNLVRSDAGRDGTLLLEVMDAATYRSLNQLPPVDPYLSDRRTPSRPTFDSYPPPAITDEPHPPMRQCFVRVRSVIRISVVQFYCVLYF